MRALLFVLTLSLSAAAFAQTPPPQRYGQLISTHSTDRNRLPADAARPAEEIGFVDKGKLPAEAKFLSAARGAAGRVWVVTDKGAFRSEGGKFLPLEAGPRRLEPGQPRVVPGLHVTAVAADRQGQLWAATEAGVFATDGDQWWQRFDRHDGVPYEVMTCLHLAPNGDVWGGTREGAWRMRDGEFRYFWGKRWLPGNVVRAIWSDKQGRAWLDTDAGIASIEERPMTLPEKAAHFDEVAQARHMRRGFISQILLKMPGNLSQGHRVHVSDNDGLWNAIYVGAMAFRYAATKDSAARKQARAALDAMLELERLTGIPGYPARAIVTDAELREGVDGVNLEETVRVPGESDKIWFRSPVDKSVWCKGDTSSDEMDGHYFAWYVYHELVADAAEKKQIAAVVRRATDHILEHGLNLVGHTGRKTRWGVWAPELLNHDPFWTEQRPLNSLEILAYLKIASHITGDAKYDQAADELIDRHHYLLNTLLIRRGASGQWNGINHSDDELLYLTYYPLLMLERNPDRRRILVQSITRTWEGSPGEQPIRLERSPLYNFIYGATTGKPCDVEAAVRTLEDWPWDMIHWTVRNRHRHDVKAKSALGVAVPQQEREVDRVLPAAERALARWNGNPWVADGGHDGLVEDDGAAWALAYWLGVYHGYLPGAADGKSAGDKTDRGKWIALFNGKNLDGWTPKIKGRDLGDNFANTFRVEDGILKVGYDGYGKNFDGRFGHLFYREPFSHYRLRVEYRFVGEQAAGGPGWAFRNSGVMVHGEAPESMEKDQEFPASIEVQLLGGNGKDERPTANLCTPGTNVVMGSELITRHCTNSRSKTYHGDQWVTVEIEVRGSELIRHIVEGKTVLEYNEPQLDEQDAHARALAAKQGKLLERGTISLQSESHPVEFRKVELLRLD